MMMTTILETYGVVRARFGVYDRPLNSAPLHIRNPAKPLKSGNIADDNEIDT